MKEENIICVPVDVMKKNFDMTKTSWTIDMEKLNSLHHEFLFRPDVEKDFTQKQLIPYAIVVNSENKVLCYQRAGSEKRLSGIWSAGIGGHVNDKDKSDTVFQTLKNGLIREFEEEIGFKLTDDMMTVCGMINEEETEVGYCHTGVVFRINIDNTNLVFDTEISNPTWLSAEEIDYSNFELWSSLAIKLVFSL